MAAAVAGFASPAHAATNPFTAAWAGNNDFGGSWAYASDGHRTISADDGTKVGDVYLMWLKGHELWVHGHRRVPQPYPLTRVGWHGWRRRRVG